MLLIDPSTLAGRERYQLMTSLVVPRPIGWLSTFGRDRIPNLAPFSYFAALSSSPMLVGVSIGERATGSKDTLVNSRQRGAFCVNVVSESLLDAMNATSAEVAPGVDEFFLAGLRAEESTRVDAPFVAQALAVLECELTKEVDLGAAPNTLLIAEVVGVRLDESLGVGDGSYAVDPAVLRPVARLSGALYSLPGEVKEIPRPGSP